MLLFHGIIEQANQRSRSHEIQDSMNCQVALLRKSAGESLQKLISQARSAELWLDLGKFLNFQNFAPAAEKRRGLVIQKRTIIVNRAVGRRT